MLYATEGIENEGDFNKAMVGVASVWCVYFKYAIQLRAHPPLLTFQYIDQRRYEGNP